jgi:hypothetical protein
VPAGDGEAGQQPGQQASPAVHHPLGGSTRETRDPPRVADDDASCYEAPLVRFRGRIVVLMVTACSGRSSEPAPTPVSIEVRDLGDKVTARVLPGHPCRAEIDGIELIVGETPFVAQDADIQWRGEDGSNGITLRAGHNTMARLYPPSSRDELGIYDPSGAAMIRVRADAKGADVLDQHDKIVRRVDAGPTGLAVREVYSVPAFAKVTGTSDAVLAAVLTSAEVGRQVRALAACHRIFASPTNVGRAAPPKAVRSWIEKTS